MARKVTYWVTTALVVVPSLLGAVTYLAGAQQAVEGFAHVGYPQQLRVLLGIAKLLGVIMILVPGFPIVKEWAYAGFTFAWIAAVVAHYKAGDGAMSLTPLALLVLLAISYATRPPGRRLPARAVVA